MSSARNRLSIHSSTVGVNDPKNVTYIQDPIRHADVCTCPKCNAKANRIAAFGAIRRAAEIMRWHEANAKRLERLRPDGLNEYEAQAIRRAIRAAIRSPKA